MWKNVKDTGQGPSIGCFDMQLLCLGCTLWSYACPGLQITDRSASQRANSSASARSKQRRTLSWPLSVVLTTLLLVCTYFS